MKTPPFLVGAALLFWGWQTGLLVWAAVMALGLEGARWLRWRWEFSATEFNRIWDATALLFLGAGIYNYNTDSITNAVLTTLQWLPIVFLSLVAAQAFSASPTIGRSTFFWLLRRKGQADPAGSGINVAYPYFALCSWRSRPRGTSPIIGCRILKTTWKANRGNGSWASFRGNWKNRKVTRRWGASAP